MVMDITPMGTTALRKWAECQQVAVRKLLDSLHPDTRQLVDKVTDNANQNPESEGVAMQMCCFRDGMRRARELTEVKLSPPTTPHGIVLWVFAVKGYCEAAEETAGRILEAHLLELRRSPETTTLPQNDSIPATAS